MALLPPQLPALPLHQPSARGIAHLVSGPAPRIHIACCNGGASGSQGHASSASPARRAGLSRGMPMKPAHHAAAPAWPPTLDRYDYLASLVARDWAWEGHGRNESYQAEAHAHAATANGTEHLEGGALVTRMQEAVS